MFNIWFLILIYFIFISLIFALLLWLFPIHRRYNLLVNWKLFHDIESLINAVSDQIYGRYVINIKWKCFEKELLQLEWLAVHVGYCSTWISWQIQDDNIISVTQKNGSFTSQFAHSAWGYSVFALHPYIISNN